MHTYLHMPQRMSKHSLSQEEDPLAASQKCLFKSHLMLETEELYFEPSQDDFQATLQETLSAFQDCTLALPNLIPDPFFHSFTR